MSSSSVANNKQSKPRRIFKRYPRDSRAGRIAQGTTRTTTRLPTKLVPALVRVFPLRFPMIMRTRTTRTNSYELCGRRAPPAGTRAGTRTTTRLQTKLVPAPVRVFPLRFPIIMRTRTTRTNSYELCGRRAPLPEFEPELVPRPSYRQNSYQHWCEFFHYDSRG